jgi:hypothetical protein
MVADNEMLRRDKAYGYWFAIELLGGEQTSRIDQFKIWQGGTMWADLSAMNLLLLCSFSIIAHDGGFDIHEFLERQIGWIQRWIGNSQQLPSHAGYIEVRVTDSNRFELMISDRLKA